MTSLRRAGVSSVLFVSLLAVAEGRTLSAQQEGKEGESANQTPETARQFVEVLEADTALRCFATEQSPLYEDRLAAGEVVEVIESDGAFRRIETPLGPIGYVHSKFVQQQEDGSLMSVGKKVSFRRRPMIEAPVTLVDAGTSFAPIALEGEWWQVRFAKAPAWVAASALGFDPERAATEWIAAYDQLGARQREKVELAMQGHRDSLARTALETEREGKLDSLRAQFLEQRQLALNERNFADVKEALGQFVADLDEASAHRQSAQELQSAIERDEYYARLQDVITEPEKPATVEEVYSPPHRDPLSRFDAIGWLRYDSGGLTGTPSLRLEKAGQLILNVTCRTGRYNLRLFDGMEVGIVGQVRRPHEQAIRAIDVHRLEVVGL